ncbi:MULTISPECIES: DUF1508 domain-containing protein [Flavobacterium]|uniref:DUF1508 domain-containing protein n=1 Tax=Flavobacterium TaxID=237 RepID=UPI00086E956D|nr:MULTISPECIES: DUF1508 domain-containing protein [Flavobacterium]MBN9284302.1 DUF1508 domain-containing protein [Flavobacterium sp.]ODS80251.1 MAG: hypothetical protein ABS44_20710 [Chryseobacterium sp. SCN 40-13]OJV72999.1 MAG: hypothetical protein BGO42_00740 [Flavobacterium sp. 40-81]
MGAFVITKRENGQYRFNYTSRKGKIILTGASYNQKVECVRDIQIMKIYFEKMLFLRFKTSSGKYFFRVVVQDQICATSRKFTTELRIAKGIEEIQRNVEAAEVLDFTEEIFF